MKTHNLFRAIGALGIALDSAAFHYEDAAETAAGLKYVVASMQWPIALYDGVQSLDIVVFQPQGQAELCKTAVLAGGLEFFQGNDLCLWQNVLDMGWWDKIRVF
jgi:hypothetical protein